MSATFPARGLSVITSPRPFPQHEFLNLARRSLGQFAKMIVFGHLNAPYSRGSRRNLRLIEARLPIDRCHKGAGCFTHFSSGRATTAASMICGCL